jgi:hypothetical protein
VAKPPRIPAGRPQPTGEPFLRFRHSKALRAKTLAVLSALERAEDPVTHRDALAGLVMELTGNGLDYFFMGPLRLAKPGFVVEQSARLGLAGVTQVMGPVVRQVIGRMNAAQLVSVCASIRNFML